MTETYVQELQMQRPHLHTRQYEIDLSTRTFQISKAPITHHAMGLVLRSSNYDTSMGQRPASLKYAHLHRL